MIFYLKYRGSTLLGNFSMYAPNYTASIPEDHKLIISNWATSSSYHNISNLLLPHFLPIWRWI